MKLYKIAVPSGKGSHSRTTARFDLASGYAHNKIKICHWKSYLAEGFQPVCYNNQVARGGY